MKHGIIESNAVCHLTIYSISKREPETQSVDEHCLKKHRIVDAFVAQRTSENGVIVLIKLVPLRQNWLILTKIGRFWWVEGPVQPHL